MRKVISKNLEPAPLNVQEYIKERNYEFEKLLEKFMDDNKFDHLDEYEYSYATLAVRDSDEWRRIKYSLKEKYNIELTIYEIRDYKAIR